jgi:tetratricopeptide (TPR) repeat protein
LSRFHTDWQASGAFRVGVACQASGRYDDAITAYRSVLSRPGFDKHVPTLHNLAVSQIRAHDAAGAIATLDRIDELIPTRRTRREMRERRWNAAYNRALALQYLNEFEKALQLTRELLRDLLAQPGVHKLEAPTLMLHAGLMLSAQDPLDSSSPEDRPVPDAVTECATAIATRSHDAAPPSRTDMLSAVNDGTERPEDIDAYVTAYRADDPRARYNLLCFHARIADRLGSDGDDIRDRAREDAKIAFRDRRLAAWAGHDPALHLKLAEDAAWHEILTPPKSYAP